MTNRVRWENYKSIPNSLLNYEADQTVVLRKSLLPHIALSKYEEEPQVGRQTEQWYPLTNSYYNFTEDVDAYARVNHLLETQTSLTSLSSIHDFSYHHIFYSQKEAQRQCLESIPPSFLILGKPDLDQEILGKNLANHWNCVSISPQSLLEEEIASGNRAGQCIEFNLRCGRAIGVDIIMKLLTRKIQTVVVQDKGFVLSGFPLVPNGLYEEEPLSSESAVFYVREIFEDIVEHTFDSIGNVSDKPHVSVTSLAEKSTDDAKSVAENVPEEEELVDFTLDPHLFTYNIGPQEISSDLEKQVSTLFNVLRKPAVVIYVFCGNTDVVNKRNECMFDFQSGIVRDMQRIRHLKQINFNDSYLNTEFYPLFSEYKYIARMPSNFPANVRTQLDTYHKSVANLIDSHILLLNNQFFIKVDGRVSHTEMFELVVARLKKMPLATARFCQRFVSNHQIVNGEDADHEQVSPLSVPEAFQKYSQQHLVGPMFPWVWSDFGVCCPVSMFSEKYVTGDPNYAVHFLNKIYFLANEKCFDKFCYNPRLYLNGCYPKPGNKFMVFGPSYSGMTTVSQCLSYLFNYQFLSFSVLFNDYQSARLEEHLEYVRQSALTEGMHVLEANTIAEFENKTQERKVLIQEWEDKCIELLQEVEGAEPERVDEIYLSLLELNLPIFNDDYCAEVVENPELLQLYIPSELKEKIVMGSITVDHPFVRDFVENKINEVDPIAYKEELEVNLYELYSNTLRGLFYDKFTNGWIIDGMTLDAVLIRQLREEFGIDEVVVLRDDSEDYSFLCSQLENHNYFHFTEFPRFFSEIDEPVALRRAASFISRESYKMETTEILLRELVERVVAECTVKTPLVDYKEHLVKFHNDWEECRTAFDGCEIVEVNVAQFSSIEALMHGVITRIRNKYRQVATEYTDQDRAEEVRAILAPTDNVMADGEGEGELLGLHDFVKNRRFGDTYHFCPVTFHNNWVLWRGKEDYTAKFNGCIYLLANPQNLKEFIERPRKFLLITKPVQHFPPPRVCVLGVCGGGKTTMAGYLSKNLGIRYVCYTNALTDTMENLEKSSQRRITEENIEDDENIIDTIDTELCRLFCKELWFEEPLKSLGFVADNFPTNLQDLETMVELNAIPDVILYVSMRRDVNMKRLLDCCMSKWRLEIKKIRDLQASVKQHLIYNWEENRRRRFQELLELRREQRYEEKLNDDTAQSLEQPNRSDTQISVDSLGEQTDIDEAMQTLDMEYPELVFNDQLETEEEAEVRLSAEIEKRYTAVLKKAQRMKAFCAKEQIDWIEVNGDLSVEKVAVQAYRATEQIQNRNQSLFERCYDVTFSEAEKLLEFGYYFLSRYGKTCPVQCHNSVESIQKYSICKESSSLYPVIHRSYIYFLAGKKNYKAFIENPLLYLRKPFVDFPLIPLRLAVIGPPKSGKSSLAKRFERDYGIKCISRGNAIRYVLANIPYSQLGTSVEKTLRNGLELKTEMAIECVNALSFLAIAAQGMIFDGFPNTIQEMETLSKFGLVPHLMFDLPAGDKLVYQFAKSKTGVYPVYSKKFTKHLLDQWKKTSDFRVWCDRTYQNIYKIKNVERSIWGVWEEAKDVFLAVASEVQHYYKHAYLDWPLRITNMLVNPLEFLQRQSSYKHYCPVCLYHFNKLEKSSNPPDRTGLVQFRDYFYWICPEHIEEFLKIPENFIVPNNRSLPEFVFIPLTLKTPPKKAVEDGYCLVCYYDNLPRRVLNKGNFRFAIEYRNGIYLFDKEECFLKFQKTPPGTYTSIVINFKKETDYPPITYYEMPILGMLEQYVSKEIVKAVTQTVRYRPVIPGLSIETSALICVGLNLKLNTNQHNVKCGYNLFHRRRKNLIHYLDVMKRILNPYARRVPVPDDRFDYLCEYFKPASKVPAFLNVVDIAGLVKGASEGQGLGNAFLSHISACDAIFHLCRAFEDDDVTHVEGDINPVRDLEIIAEELRLKDEDTLEKNLEKLERTVVRGTDKKLKPEYDTLVKIKGVLVDEKKHIRFGDWDLKDIEVLNKYLFLTSKPTIYLVNLAEKDYIKKKNKWLIKIKEWVDKNDPGALIIPFSGGFEHKLVEEYDDAALRSKFLEEVGVTSALDKIIVQGYKALQLEYFFTAGPDEVKAWTIQKATKAPQAAGRIHTDFEKGFIMAEVMKFVDFKEEGSEAACKSAGKYRQQGRNYTVEDGDVIFFKFNAGAGLKDAKKK